MMDDKIITNCSACNGQFRIPAKYAGKTIKCPKCQQPLEIPNISMQAPPMSPPPLAPPPIAPQDQNDAVKISAWDKAKPAPQKVGGIKKTPTPARKAPVRRAPSQAKNASRKPSRPGSRPKSRTHSGHKSGTRGRSSGVREGGRKGFRDDRFEPEKKNNLPMIVGISAAGLVLLVVIIAVVFSGGPGKTPDSTTVTDTNNPDGGKSSEIKKPPVKVKTPEQIRKENIENAKKDIANVYENAVKNGNMDYLYSKLESWKGMIGQYTELTEDFELYLSKYIEEQEKIIEDIYESNAKAEKLLKFASNIKNISDRVTKADDLLNKALAIADDITITDRIHTELGHVKYHLPVSEDWDKILRLGIAETKLEELQMFEERWIPQTEYRQLKQLEKEIFDEYLSLTGGDPFMLEIQKAKQRLNSDPFFKDFEFGVVAAKPFAILLQQEDDEDYIKSINNRKKTLLQFWAQIKKNWVERLHMKSNIAGDSPEQPKPFTFVSFRDRPEFDSYLKSVDKTIPSFARAFYSNVTKFVMFYKDTRPNASSHFEFAVVAHEATHQVHDRYSDAKSGLKDIKSYWILEGFAELMAGHKTDKDGNMKFQNINYPARMGTFSMLKQAFGDKDSYVYDTLKDDNGMPFLPPREDWNVVPIECLVTMRGGSYVMWYGRILAQIYEQGFAKAFIKGGRKDQKLAQKSIILSRRVGDPGNFIHGQFYANAWAFTQFMTQRYPDEYDKIFLEVTSGKPVVQAFSKAMKLGLDLPDIEKYLGSTERREKFGKELTQGLFKQIKMIQTHDRVIKLQNEFNTWLKEQYKFVMGKPLVPGGTNVQPDDSDDDNTDDDSDDDDENDDDEDDDDWIPFSNWNE